MKYVPFVFLSIMAVLGSVQNSYGQWSFNFGYDGVVSLLLMASYSAFLFYLGETENLNDSRERIGRVIQYLDRLDMRVNSLESSKSTNADDLKAKVERIEKSLIISMEQITELDRRLSGNDPFGG